MVCKTIWVLLSLKEIWTHMVLTSMVLEHSILSNLGMHCPRILGADEHVHQCPPQGYVPSFEQLPQLIKEPKGSLLLLVPVIRLGQPSEIGHLLRKTVLAVPQRLALLMKVGAIQSDKS